MGTNAYFTYSVVGFRGTVSAFLMHRPANSYSNASWLMTPTTTTPHFFWKTLQGNVSYESAVTAVAIEGAIFFVLAATGLRYKIIRLIPEVSYPNFATVFLSSAFNHPIILYLSEAREDCYSCWYWCFPCPSWSSICRRYRSRCWRHCDCIDVGRLSPRKTN